MDGESADAVDGFEAFLVALARARVDGKRAAEAHEQAQRGETEAGALRRCFEAPWRPAQLQVLARRKLRKLLGRLGFRLGLDVPEMEDQAVRPVLERHGRRLEERDSRACLAQPADRHLRGLEVRLGDESQAEARDLRAVHADVRKAVQSQPPLQHLDRPAAQHRATSVRRSTEPDERGTRGRIRPQVTVRGPLRERRVEREEREQTMRLRDALAQALGLRPERPDCPCSSCFRVPHPTPPSPGKPLSRRNVRTEAGAGERGYA